MFSATASDVKLLRDSIDTAAQIIDEANFKFKPEGLELTASDRAMVVVVDLKISAKAFSDYNCDKEETAGLNLLNFLTILRRAGPSDKISLKLDGSRLHVTLTGDSVRNFAVPILELSTGEVPNIGQFNCPATAEVRADVISDGISDADVIADSAIFELGENFRMSAESDSSKTELILEKGSVALPVLTAEAKVKSRYPLEYLKKMIKAGKICDRAKISLGNDYPLRMDFVSELCKISFVLAPRVSEE